MKSLIVSILILFLIGSYAQASDSLSISNLSIDQGLSNNSVRCIYQDHNGFMWFGTYDGLNRYDGYQFKVFRNKFNDTNSLPHNYIYTIQEDENNNLWVGTGQGIGIYNNLTSKFSPAYYFLWQDANKRSRKITANINILKEDDNGNMFIGTNGWGLLIKKASAQAAEQIPFEKATGKTADYNIQTCFIDKNKKVWLFLADIGLCSYDYGSNKIILENNELENGYSLQEDGNGNVWIGSNNGLYKYNINSKILVKAYTDMPGSLTSNAVVNLFLDQKQNLWAGTEGGGIDILNTKTGNFSYILPGEGKGMLSSESVFSIYRDWASRIWIGTLKGGINIIDPFKKQFQSFAHNPLSPNSLIYNFVSSFYEDENQHIWIGTDGGGMSIWDKANGTFTNFRHDAGNPKSISSNLVSSISKDYTGNYWVATYGGGINRYNKATAGFDHYKCINTATGEENKNAWLILEDRDKVLWVTTFAGGRVYQYNRLQDKFEMFDSDLTDIISLKQDATGKMWAGDSHQLIEIGKPGNHTYFEIGKPVRSIYEDGKGNFWLGTEGGGLVLFDRKLGKIIARYSDADGLSNNSVLNIVGDDKGNVWLSTFNGLSKFNVEAKSFKNYFIGDGLQSNQFLYNAALRLKSGELMFGGIKGFTIFNPDSLFTHNSMPPVFITRLLVNNKPVTVDSGYVTKNDGNSIQELKIPYDEAVLSFDFAALEYSVPDKISYKYFLEGWDKGWNYTGTLRTANYTHLKEGTYYLHIKSTNAAGEWNTNETTLKIIVLPPWYRTWWAYLFYLCIIVSLVYLYIRYKTQQTKLAYEIKIAHLETEKEKELNEKKLSFFTEMSHEFRTPLTLIINPVKDLLKNADKNSRTELDIVYRNARRLLSLIDQLLLFRKADTDANKLKITKVNYTLLCKEVYLCFSQEAKTRNIEYILNSPEELYVLADRQKIEIALYNLLSNAIKYTPAKGSIHFDVVENEHEIITSIKDSGPGIPNKAGDKIFEKFYQDINEQSVSKPGFGIGLYLAKNVMENHQGAIHYQSKEGKGTTFTLTLPKGDIPFGTISTEIIQAETSLAITEEIAERLPHVAQEPEKQEELVTPDATLLIVDDNEQMRNYIISIFSDKYKIFHGSSGEEGLQIAKEQLPDLIISDIVMQQMNGMEMCNLIKKDPALGHIPVILLTGSASPEGRLKGIEYGADDYITKPFEKDLLVARVVNLLKNRSVLQNYFYNEITLQKNNLKVSEEYKSFLEKCIAIVEAHLDDDNFNIQTLASEIGMSHSNLYKKVKSVSGQSVNAFIRFIRLRKAAEIFIHTNQNVNETAFQVGINNVKYFREQFNKLFGINPSEYIKKYRKAFGNSYRLNKKAFGEDASMHDEVEG